jgi:hypothetical protein
MLIEAFFAQLVNTFVLGGIGLAALYFVQRPQVVGLEAAQAETEKNHVATLMLEAERIADDTQRRRFIHLIALGWPQYEFARAVDDSVNENAVVLPTFEGSGGPGHDNGGSGRPEGERGTGPDRDGAQGGGATGQGDPGSGKPQGGGGAGRDNGGAGGGPGADRHEMCAGLASQIPILTNTMVELDKSLAIEQNGDGATKVYAILRDQRDKSFQRLREAKTLFARNCPFPPETAH